MIGFVTKEKLRPVLIGFGDLIFVLMSYWLAHLIRFGETKSFGDKFPSTFLAILPLVYLSVFYFFDLYTPASRYFSLSFLTKMSFAVVGGSLGAFLFKYVFFLFPIGRGLLFLASCLIFIFATAWRACCDRSLRYLIKPRQVLVVGVGQSLAEAGAVLESNPEEFRVVGFLKQASDQPGQNQSLATYAEIGPIQDLLLLITHYHIDLLVLATTQPLSSQLINDLLIAESRGIEILDLPDIYQRLKKIIPINHIKDENWFLKSRAFYALNSPIKVRIKRFMDLLLGLLVFLLALPLWPLIALLIKITSKGPVFYSQERIGKNETRFFIHKFRSMIEKAEEDEPLWARENDQRVTAIGRILRRFHLDELPQLWNVIKGEMSLVGPRPERPWFSEKLSTSISYYNLRLLGKPGMTGWAQINYPYAASLQDSKEKLEYDLYYLVHFNFLLDLKILIRTFQSIIFRGKLSNG